MTREEAITLAKAILESQPKHKNFSDFELMMNDFYKLSIEALEKQNEIVHCKDCENWNYPVQIEGLDGSPAGTAGACALTGWLCGEQGYCMYGKEVE